MSRPASTWTVAYGKDDFLVILSETPKWAILITVVYDRIIALLGEPCCYEYRSGRRTWAGVVHDMLPDRAADWWSVWQYRLMNNPLAMCRYRHERRVLSLPLTADQARVVAPSFFDECMDTFDDDSDA